MEDSKIIDLYWVRSQQAIAESENKYGAYCRTVARNILDRAEDAEECVNDTWLRAWNVMPPQRPAVLQAFFGKLTRNLSLDRWRRERAQKRGGSQVELALEELEDCLAARDRVEEKLDAKYTAGLISDFVRGLPQQDRILFVGRYWYLDDIQTLARRMGMGQSQVKSRLHRIRRRLKAELEKEGVAV
ncbi:MAG: sigma-70 family RNA polymerase sigma factor [Oscillospiraceae bacterium]|nr:sigma-70 family RNA polymerase sigma factor [Oscillospiraceae bacterium]